ncbi:DUF4959 domain-containing protein [Marinilabiliaceae bacterium JC017]|nr:DUF4959 domain-containing protein [Marinilabiliaceae bacterium JC017]
MKTLKLALWALFTSALVFTGCSEDDDADTTPPSNVTDLSVESGDMFLKITWTQPEEDDFDKVKITLNHAETTVDKGTNQLIVEKLENGREYTFQVTTMDLAGNQSEKQTIKGIPRLLVKTFEGTYPEKGTYINNDDFKMALQLGDNNSYKMAMLDFRWYGTLTKTTVGTFVCSTEEKSILNPEMVTTSTDSMNIALTFTNENGTFYAQRLLEKVEGDVTLLPGKYTSFNYSKEIGSEYCIKKELTVKEDGTYVMTVTDQEDKTGNWSTEDIRKGTISFIKVNYRTFLLTENDRLYTKL